MSIINTHSDYALVYSHQIESNLGTDEPEQKENDSEKVIKFEYRGHGILGLINLICPIRLTDQYCGTGRERKHGAHGCPYRS